MVFGTFDLLHPGHVYLIEEAAHLGKVTVVVARDETVLQIKGRKPRESLKQRKKTIEQRFPEAIVVAGSASDFLEPIRNHRPDIILLGYDQKLPPGVTKKSVTAASLPPQGERLSEGNMRKEKRLKFRDDKNDLPKILRAKAHRPEKFKSSLMKGGSKRERK